MIAMSLSFTTVLKFYILITKSVPEMDETDIAKKAILSITIISSILSGLKFSGDTKPTFNQVRINVHMQTMKMISIILVSTGYLHGIL